MNEDEQVVAHQDRVVALLKWSAKIGGLYFCLRFIGVVLLQTIWVAVFPPIVWQSFNFLIPVFALLCSAGFYEAVQYNVRDINQQGNIGYIFGLIGSLSLAIVGLLLAVIPVAISNIAGNYWVEYGSGFVEILLVILAITSMVGFGVLAYISNQLGQLKVLSGVYLILGVLGILSNLLTIFPPASYYLALMGWPNLLGLGWYFGLHQLIAYIQTGKDQPTAAF